MYFVGFLSKLFGFFFGKVFFYWICYYFFVIRNREIVCDFFLIFDFSLILICLYGCGFFILILELVCFIFYFIYNIK